MIVWTRYDPRRHQVARQVLLAEQDRAVLLPHVMEAYIRILRRRAPESEGLRRYDEVAQILSNQSDARGEDGAAWIQELCADLDIPALGMYGMKEAHFPDVVARSGRSSSMKGNPVALTETEMSEILGAAL